jgi:hypothetical protein
VSYPDEGALDRLPALVPRVRSGRFGLDGDDLVFLELVIGVQGTEVDRI